MRRRRCLIPADGFYEWKEIGGRKQAYFVRLKQSGPFAFAGLWETWTGPNGEEMDTTAIVTTNANRTLAALHDRMPVILPPEAFDLWLDTAKVDEHTAAARLVPARDDLVEEYEVSPAVNRVANDDARLVEPLPPGAVAEAAPPATNVSRAAARPKASNKSSDEPTLF
jgi:putative SOS response-associated peptidase YedK